MKQKASVTEWKWEHDRPQVRGQVWGAAEAVLREKSVALNTYIRKQEEPQINNLSSHPKKLKKKGKSTPKARRQKELIKHRNQWEKWKKSATVPLERPIKLWGSSGRGQAAAPGTGQPTSGPADTQRSHGGVHTDNCPWSSHIAHTKPTAQPSEPFHNRNIQAYMVLQGTNI